ncbi:PadR family transcriptional regulator [Paenibacillus senegalensis]|uniref:PadR family transcriptional regulator n=1 Tax=Paenibacillus senegalensis TaxID=1465766 RepID=UPI000288970E|nr:PadR family transcriptional regulator [Paenibacillus senegalensis]
MSVKHAILSLLYEKPRHGYELKTGFDHLVQKKWAINPGQIYTTLDRLVRDEWVESPGQDDKDRKIYSLTAKGREELVQWLAKPVDRLLIRDEMYFKWLCAAKVGYDHKKQIITQQRELVIKEILYLTRFKKELKQDNQEEMLDLVEGALLHLEADLKWLDLMSSKLKPPASL